MNKLYEQDIVNNFIGKKVNEERLRYIFRKNGSREEYITYPSDWEYEKEKLELFKITGRLMDHWLYYGIFFMVSIEVKDGIIVPRRYNTMLCKGRTTGIYGSSRGYHLVTQQELRILSRILEYITTE